MGLLRKLTKGGDRVKKIGYIAAVWVVAISALHMALNVDWNVLLNDRLPLSKRKLNVAYIPVT
jgi:hypothetical protein